MVYIHVIQIKGQIGRASFGVWYKCMIMYQKQEHAPSLLTSAVFESPKQLPSYLLLHNVAKPSPVTFLPMYQT